VEERKADERRPGRRLRLRAGRVATGQGVCGAAGQGVCAEDVSTDPRARRRRTIPQGQLALALDGLVEHVYAYSFIATNLDVSTPAKAVAVEAWHRMRTDIDDGIRDAKHGAALRHLPSANRAANTVWLWGALLAVNLSAWLQELAGLNTGDGRGRAHLGTLRHRQLIVPARLVRHAGQGTRGHPQGNSNRRKSGPATPAAYPDLTARPHQPRPTHGDQRTRPRGSGSDCCCHPEEHRGWRVDVLFGPAV
jgi:hypothetical protein